MTVMKHQYCYRNIPTTDIIYNSSAGKTTRTKAIALRITWDDADYPIYWVRVLVYRNTEAISGTKYINNRLLMDDTMFRRDFYEMEFGL